jgi:hypothetical protein
MRVREMMANAAQWLAEGLPARAEYARGDESIRRALIRELRSQGRYRHATSAAVADPQCYKVA